MATIPTINFKSSISEEEYTKLETQTSSKASKFFEPGTYDLKILEVVKNVTERNPTGMSKSDPTWSVFKVTLGGLDSREIRYYLLAPTVKDTFGTNPKSQTLMAIKFRRFMRGIGIDTKDVGLAAFSNKLHQDPSSLVGRDVQVKIGFNGAHLKYNEDPKGYVVVDRRDNPDPQFDGNIYPDRASATVAAAALGVVLQSFAEVQSFEDLTDVAGQEESPF